MILGYRLSASHPMPLKVLLYFDNARKIKVSGTAFKTLCQL